MTQMMTRKTVATAGSGAWGTSCLRSRRVLHAGFGRRRPCVGDVTMMVARVQVGDLDVAPGVGEVGWWPQGGGRSKASCDSTSRFTTTRG